jgi:hypothetical protein
VSAGGACQDGVSEQRDEHIGIMNSSDEGYSITEHIFERRDMETVCNALDAGDLLRTKAGGTPRPARTSRTRAGRASCTRAPRRDIHRRASHTVSRHALRQVRCVELAGGVASGHRLARASARGRSVVGSMVA